PVIAAVSVVDRADVISGNYDLAGGRAAPLLAGVDRVTAAGQQVVGDPPVLLHAVVLEQADRVGLAAIDEDRVVTDRQRGDHSAVRRHAVRMVAGQEAGFVDVVAGDQSGLDLDPGFEPGDVVVEHPRPGRVAVDILDPGHHAAGSGVQPADR